MSQHSARKDVSESLADEDLGKRLTLPTRGSTEHIVQPHCSTNI